MIIQLNEMLGNDSLCLLFAFELTRKEGKFLNNRFRVSAHAKLGFEYDFY